MPHLLHLLYIIRQITSSVIIRILTFHIIPYRDYNPLVACHIIWTTLPISAQESIHLVPPKDMLQIKEKKVFVSDSVFRRWLPVKFLLNDQNKIV